MIYEVIHVSNEMDLLDIHFHELKDIVEKFIIVEHSFDYLRKPRRMYYEENKERFKEFHHKIIHIQDNSQYDTRLGLDLMAARNHSPLIYNALLALNDENAFVIFSDTDVILRKECFANIDISKPVRFSVAANFHYFDYTIIGGTFYWTVGVPIKFMKEFGMFESVRHVRGEILPVIDSITIVNAGYHFSKCGNLDDVLEHMKGHPHIEIALNPNICTKERLQNRRDVGRHWDDLCDDPLPPGIFGFVKYDPKDYPEYINEHSEIYSSYFKHGMNR